MNSGTFHVMSQQWRYFSREKSIVHTLHLAQLQASRRGDTVLIAPTAPTQNQSTTHGSIGPLAVPSGPYFQTNLTNVTDTSIVTDCYGCVNYNGQILAQKNMGINVISLGGSLAEIDMTPTESGFFVVHVEASSDLHSLSYQGVANDGQIMVQIMAGGILAAQAVWRCRMEGGGWTPAHNALNSIGRTAAECIVPAGSFRGFGYNLGSVINGARFAMWAYKMADYG